MMIDYDRLASAYARNRSVHPEVMRHLVHDGMEHVGFAGIADQAVEFAYELTDARPYRDRAFSVLHMIGEEAFPRGLGHLEQDLRAGPIPCVSRYLMLWGTRR